ncbi:hypothetical protein Tco_1240705 [Tanacetum coccineum]
MNSIKQCIIERASHEQELKMMLKKLSERHVRTFKFQLSQHMNNLDTLLNAETLHEMDSKSVLSVIKVQFERASHEQERKMTLKKLSERQLQIQQCKVQEVSPEESSSTSQPLDQVQNHDENNVFANIRRHSEQPESINDTYVLEKDDSNVIPDSSNICTNDNQVVYVYFMNCVLQVWICHKKDKNEAKRTKPITGMIVKSKPKAYTSLNGPTRTHLMGWVSPLRLIL